MSDDKKDNLTTAELEKRAFDKRPVYQRFVETAGKEGGRGDHGRLAKKGKADREEKGEFEGFLKEMRSQEERLKNYEEVLHPQREQKKIMKDLVSKGDFFSWQDLVRKSAAKAKKKRKKTFAPPGRSCARLKLERKKV